MCEGREVTTVVWELRLGISAWTKDGCVVDEQVHARRLGHCQKPWSETR